MKSLILAAIPVLPVISIAATVIIEMADVVRKNGKVTEASASGTERRCALVVSGGLIQMLSEGQLL